MIEFYSGPADRRPRSLGLQNLMRGFSHLQPTYGGKGAGGAYRFSMMNDEEFEACVREA